MRTKRVMSCVTAFFLGGLASQYAYATDETVTVQRPGFQTLRFQEDWSTLRGHDLTQTGDMWDRIKFIPLSEDGSIWLSLGGQMQSRLEYWNDFAFGAPADPDDAFLLWRLLLHADLHVGEHFRVFVEGKSALATDRSLPGGKRTLDVDTLALEQAFLDVSIPLGDDATLTVRPGRQQFLFGKQRLVSPLPWANTQRRWDGISAIFNCGAVTVHGFWSQFVPVRKYDFNEPDGQTQFFGVYATMPVHSPTIKLDAYFLGLDIDDMVTFNGTTGTETRYTLGGRLFGTVADTNFDFDIEGAYQFGKVGAGDVTAFMIGSELGYRLKDVPTAPRFHVGFDYASGDDAAGGDVETFNQLYPLGHAFMGYMDFIGRQNIIDVSAGVSLKPMDQMTIGCDVHVLWRASDMDALYNAGGTIVRPGAAGMSSEVGQELDLTIKYVFDRHLTGLLGYSHFFAGDFINQSGAGKDMDFVYLQMQFTF